MYTSRCVKELLDGDADITKVDKEQNNALHIGCIHGQLDVVQFLLHGGLSPELRYEFLYINLLRHNRMISSWVGSDTLSLYCINIAFHFNYNAI